MFLFGRAKGWDCFAKKWSWDITKIYIKIPEKILESLLGIFIKDVISRSHTSGDEFYVSQTT